MKPSNFTIQGQPKPNPRKIQRKIRLDIRFISPNQVPFVFIFYEPFLFIFSGAGWPWVTIVYDGSRRFQHNWTFFFQHNSGFGNRKKKRYSIASSTMWTRPVFFPFHKARARSRTMATNGAPFFHHCVRVTRPSGSVPQ